MANRHSAELARKVHWTFRLNKLTLRVAFARYALSAKAGRRASNSYLTQPLQKPASQTPAKNKKTAETLRACKEKVGCTPKNGRNFTVTHTNHAKSALKLLHTRLLNLRRKLQKSTNSPCNRILCNRRISQVTKLFQTCVAMLKTKLSSH